MTSLKDPPKLGPWQKVTPTNADGDANSESAPTVTVPVSSRASASTVTLNESMIGLPTEVST